jgi:metal-sulfur cluster biosynthetic enzyme
MALRRGLTKLAKRAAGKALGRSQPSPRAFEPKASVRSPAPSPPSPEAAASSTAPRPPKPPELAEPDAAWPEGKQDLHRRLVAALRQVYDPEIPINIFDLGLVYAVEIGEEGKVKVDLTLTSPACPMGPLIVEDTTRAVRETEGVVYPRVDLVWDPPWDPSELPEETRLELGFF